MKKIVFAVIMILCSLSAIQAQKKEEKKGDKENLLVKLQEGAKPKIIVDGKVFDFPMELIDQTKVTSMMVVKKQEALKKYNAPDGVILIRTKFSESTDLSNKVSGDKKIGGKNGPKVIIDGKISNQKAVEKLTPNLIEKMEVIKGEKALKKYNAPNGAIIITTKKK